MLQLCARVLVAQDPDRPVAHLAPTAGELRGIVAESAQQPVSGATIRVRRVQGKTEYTAVSADDGSFEVPKVGPGTYQVSAAKKGFAKSPRSTFELSAAQSFEVDLALGATSLQSGFFKRILHAYVTDWKGAQR